MTPESDGSGQAHLDVSKPGAEEPPMSRGSRVPATAFASAVLSLIGGGLMVLGSFLPLTVGLGLVLGTAGFAILLGRHVRARSLMIPAVVALVAIGWVAIPNELEMNVPHGPSWISWNGHGWGLGVVALGAVLAVVAGGLAGRPGDQGT